MPTRVSGSFLRRQDSVHVTRRSLLRTGQFRRALIGQFISQTFDAACTLLLAKVFFFGTTGDPASSQVMSAAATAAIPLLLGGPIAGFMVDRFPRRALLVAGQATRAGFALLYLGLVITDAGHHVYFVAAASLCAGRVMYAARVASVRHLVRQHELVAADSLMLSLSTVAGASGAGLGAAAYVVAGPAGFMFVAVGQLLGAVVYAGLGVPLGGGREHVPASVRQVAAALARPKIRYAILATSSHRMAVGMIVAVTVLSSGSLPGPAEAQYGLAMGAVALGAFAATFSAEWLNEHLKRRAVSMLSFGAAATAVAFSVLAGSAGSRVACLFVLGHAFQTLRVSADATVQKNAPRGSGGRVFTAYDTAYNGAYLLGIVLGAAFIPRSTPGTVLTWCTLWFVGAAAVFAVMSREEVTASPGAGLAGQAESALPDRVLLDLVGPAAERHARRVQHVVLPERGVIVVPEGDHRGVEGRGD